MAKNDDNVTELHQKVQFNLGTAQKERDRKEAPKPPFVASLLPAVDKVVTLTNPRKLTVEEFESLDQDNPLAFLALCVPDEEDREALRQLQAEDFDLVLTSYFEHFGIGDKGKGGGRLF